MPKVKPLSEQNATLKQIFKVAMIKKGWSQHHLSKICELSDAQISRVINTPDKCQFSSVQKVAKKLSIKNIPIF